MQPGCWMRCPALRGDCATRAVLSKALRDRKSEKRERPRTRAATPLRPHWLPMRCVQGLAIVHAERPPENGPGVHRGGDTAPPCAQRDGGSGRKSRAVRAWPWPRCARPRKRGAQAGKGTRNGREEGRWWGVAGAGALYCAFHHPEDRQQNRAGRTTTPPRRGHRPRPSRGDRQRHAEARLFLARPNVARSCYVSCHATSRSTERQRRRPGS